MNSSLTNTESQQIRQKFRKEIRRRQIEQIFATKRRLWSQQVQNTEDAHNKNLQQLYDAIKNKHKLGESLTKLGNFLSDQDCLKRTSYEVGDKKMQQLCIQITHTIFNVLLPQLSMMGCGEVSKRRKCLATISNIMADSLAPHSQMIPIISQGLNSIYTNIPDTSHEQSTEMGWIIANTFCHKLDLSIEAELEKPIQELLTIAQQLVLIYNDETIPLMYKNLKKFFQHLDAYFNRLNQKPTQTQHFKVHRMILLQNTVNYNLDIKMGSLLLSIIPFVQSNINYANSCNQKLPMQICQKCFAIMKCASSDKIMVATFGLVKKLVNDQQIVITIVKDYFDILERCLTFYGVKIKIQAIRLLMELCVNQQITTFIANGKQLEHLIVQLIKSARDSDTQVELIKLTYVIVDKTKQKFGMQAVATIQNCLIHKSGAVREQASHLIQSCQFKME